MILNDKLQVNLCTRAEPWGASSWLLDSMSRQGGLRSTWGWDRH